MADFQLPIIYLFVFLFGLIVGSFLNCVIYRLHRGRSFLFQRSICPHCNHKLSFFDLIPVLSFLVLKGRCRYCKKKISWQYPLVELATGVIFILIFRHLSFEFGLAFELWAFLTLCFMLCVSCFMIVIFVYDLRHYVIPDKALYPAITIALLYNIYQLAIGNQQLAINNFLSALAASSFFLLIYLISRGRWIGFGDVKLGLFLGLILGWPKVLLALFLTYLIGGIIGMILVITRLRKLKSQIPFAPFLIIATFITLFWGEAIINWYLKFF